MKICRSSSLIALLLTAVLALGAALRGQETPPAPPAPPAEKKADETISTPAEKKSDQPAPADKVADEKKLEATTAKTDDENKDSSAIEEKAAEGMDKMQQKTDELTDQIIEKARAKALKSEKKTHHAHHHDEAPPFGDHLVAAGANGEDAVSVFGSTTVDGDVDGEAVSVFGSTTVNGSVTGEAVSVFGTTHIDGHVGGEAVAVFGDIELGPKAVVDGDVSVVFGRVVRDPGAQVHGQVIAAIGAVGGLGDFHWLQAYLRKCVRWGRPLGIGEDLGWAWLVAAGFLLFYVLLALLFPRGLERSVETLEERPGGTVLAAVLTLLLTPFLVILLCVTVIGIALIPVLLTAMLVGTLFGKAAVHLWLGRRLAKLFGIAVPSVVLAVVMGGAFLMLLYLVPFLGFLLWKLFGALGLGMVVYRLLLSTQREKPGVAAAVPPPPAAVGAGVAPTEPGAASAAVVPPVLPPVIVSAVTLPRAGFWIRIAASALDAVMVGIICAFLGHVWHGFGGAYPFWYAVYCVVMWGSKGTTIGGIICGLKVVRLDDRRVDWGVAIVRALAAFLSLAVAGLGFIWVAFDNEKQSWHDKISGTTIVKVPKGTPLL